MAPEVANQPNRVSRRAELMAELGLTTCAPAHRRASRWHAVTPRDLTIFLLGAALFLVVILKSEPGFVFLLDHASLLFHEAGHPIYGILSERLAVYGGTLGQLTFPVILAVSFWRKAEAVPVAISCIWFFENFLNIARYMADARAQILPLVGGGDHDWNEIFTRWNVLSHDTTIAAVTQTIGWIGMTVPLLWIIYRGIQDKRANRNSPA